jgi:hypothetical protein
MKILIYDVIVKLLFCLTIFNIFGGNGLSFSYVVFALQAKSEESYTSRIGRCPILLCVSPLGFVSFCAYVIPNKQMYF